MNKTIVAFGNPLLDTIVIVNHGQLIQKYNLETDSQKEISKNEMNKLKEDIQDYAKTQISGGCAQNTLKVLQWICNKQHKVIIFGAIGNDINGETLKNDLKQYNIHTNYNVNDSLPTGTTVSLVYKKSRSLFAYLGAAEHISLTDLEENPKIFDDIKSADLIYIEGFFITKRIEPAVNIIRNCTQLKKTVVFNLCGEYLCKKSRSYVEYFIEKSNIIFGNKNEFKTLCTFIDETNLEIILKHYAKMGKILVVTDGAGPIIYTDTDTNLYSFTVPVMNRENIIDTTGAGDAFVGGFLHAFLLQKSIKKCIEFGCFAAQEIIKRQGCTTPDHLLAPDIL